MTKIYIAPHGGSGKIHVFQFPTESWDDSLFEEIFYANNLEDVLKTSFGNFEWGYFDELINHPNPCRAVIPASKKK